MTYELIMIMIKSLPALIWAICVTVKLPEDKLIPSNKLSQNKIRL
jgi:hypothetical protein